MATATSDMHNRLKFLKDPTTVALSGTTARNAAALAPGLYEVWADADWFMLQGGSAVDATTSSIPVEAKQHVLVHVDEVGSKYIAGILSSGTGTMYIVQRGS